MIGSKVKSVQRRWLQSYAIVLLIPIIMMSATYMQTRRVIEEEIQRANSALLFQLQQEIDSYVDYVYRLAEITSLNPRVMSLIRNQENVGWSERLAIWQTLADFRSYNIARRYVDHFYIYFHQGDFVLTHTSYYDSDMYYNIHLSSSGISKDVWLNYLMQEPSRQFVSWREFTETDKRITFTHSLSVQTQGTSASTLVVQLNQEQLMASVHNIQSYNEGMVYILDGSSRLIASSEADVDEQRLFSILDEAEAAQEQAGTITADWHGEEVILSYIESNQNSWKYIYVLPTYLYSEKAQYVRNMTLLTLTIAVIIGSVSAIWLTRRNYHPLQKLIRNVAERSNLDPLSMNQFNEYGYLEEALEDALDRNNLMNRTIENQKKTLRSNLLARILKGRISIGFPIVEVLPEYGIHFQSENVAVVLFYIEDYSAFFRQNEQDEEKKREFVQLIMTNIVEELANQHHQGWMTEVDEMLACIINIQANTPSETAKEDIRKLVEEAQRFIGNRFQIQFTISVSTIRKTAAELPSAYQEAMEAMEYRMLLGNQTIIWHDQIRHQELSYSYSLEREQQLINHIIAGDFEQARQTVNDIIKSNLSQEYISVEMIRCLMFDICSTMMKAAMEANLDHSELFEENQKAIRELLSGTTVLAMQNRMTLFLQKICGHTEKRRKKSKFKLKENVEAYIHENYKDHNLSITTISEHFDVHPSYLSRYFKEQAGDNLTEYINKYRVEKSKQLLMQEEILIRDISDLVGFYSISTFIRLFKKHEGVTPSTYRERSGLIKD